MDHEQIRAMHARRLLAAWLSAVAAVASAGAMAAEQTPVSPAPQPTVGPPAGTVGARPAESLPTSDAVHPAKEPAAVMRMQRMDTMKAREAAATKSDKAQVNVQRAMLANKAASAAPARTAAKAASASVPTAAAPSAAASAVKAAH